MKTKISIIFWALFFVVAIFIVVLLLSNEIKINRYYAMVDVESDGNMTVTETMEVENLNGYRIRFRDIAYGKNHSNNPLFDDIDYNLYRNDQAVLDVASLDVKVYDGDGQEITSEFAIKFNGDTYEDTEGYNQTVECYPASITCNSIVVDASERGGFDDKMIFVYQYTISNVLTTYQDVSELNWVLFRQLDGKVKEATVVVNFSDPALVKENLYAWGHGLSSGNIEIEDKRVVLTAKNISTDEEFEFRIMYENQEQPDVTKRNYVDVLMKDEIVQYETELADATNRQYVIATIFNVITILVAILTVFVFIIVYKKYDKEYKAEYDGEYCRELPFDYTPAQMSYLYHFKKTNNEDVTATILDLIRKGYLELDTNASSVNDDNPDFTIIRTTKSTDDLFPHEKHIISWFIDLVGDGQKVTIKEIEKFGAQNYTNAQKFQKYGAEFTQKVKASTQGYNFFETKPKGLLLSYGILLVVFGFALFLIGQMFGVTAIVNLIAFIILGFAFCIYVSTIKRRTKGGNEQYAKWKAFKHFLEDFSTMKDYPIPGIQIWEHYLVYATSLKIADKVMKQLEVKLPPSAIENTSTTTYLHRGYYGRHYMFGFSVNINNAINRGTSNSISTIAQHNSSSGSGRGGGFSGGSSFGGGGGGARSIR